MSECAVKARRTGVAAAPAIAVLAAFAVAPATALAQGAVSARDLQTRCIVNSIPNAEALTVSWTGECNSGRANGVGDVIAFSAGKLRYILRGQFRDGDLLRQENVRDCAANVCADDVPRSLLRLHEQAAMAGGATRPGSSAGVVVAVPPVTAPTNSARRWRGWWRTPSRSTSPTDVLRTSAAERPARTPAVPDPKDDPRS